VSVVFNSEEETEICFATEEQKITNVFNLQFERSICFNNLGFFVTNNEFDFIKDCCAKQKLKRAKSIYNLHLIMPVQLVHAALSIVCSRLSC